jgi:glycosyltransferase involved in cell wall biosynthesis
MRICLDARVHTLGGASTFIRSFLDQLSRVEHSHEFTLIVARTNRFQLAGAACVEVGASNRLTEVQWSQFGLRRFLARGRFDVYHSLKLVGPIFCPTPTVYRMASVGQYCGNYPQPMLEYLYWSKLKGSAYRRAELVITVSDYIRRGALEHLRLRENRVVTIPNGVDPQFRPLSPAECEPHNGRQLGLERPFLLCAGNLVEVKNYPTALRAFSILCQRGNRDHQLVFAGSENSPEYGQLLNLAGRERISHRVRFLGRQDTTSMLRLYNSADLMIHPSFHEGMSFSVVEAMACGLPLVVAATTSLPETAGPAALYVEDPRDAVSFADQIQRVLDDTQLHCSLRSNGIQQARRFTWQRCVDETLNAYRRLT